MEATPCPHADVSQNVAEPILIKYASQRGFKCRFDCKFLSFTEDSASGLITSTLEDQITRQKLRVVSKYLCGADGTQSYVARQLGLPFQESPSGGQAFNIWYEADLSHLYRLNPGLLHSLSTPYMENPRWAAHGINRVIRPYSEFIMATVSELDASVNISEEQAVNRLRQLFGDESIDIKIKGIYKWKINEAYAEVISKGNIFCLGDAIHKHPPGNGLGSNTCIQDAYNLAWKLAYVLKGLAGPSLLASYNAERQPVGRRIVKIANDTFRIHWKLHKILGISIPNLEERVKALEGLQEKGPEARQRRIALRKALKDVEHETAGLGGEMNQKYSSGAVCVADESWPGPVWEEGSQGVLHHTISTFPGFRLPHAWLGTKVVGERISTHDLAGHGEFTLFTGIGGREAWREAAESASKATGVKINVHSIGFGQDYSDMFYMWEDRREVEEDGAVLVRPDRTIGWRSKDLSLTGSLLVTMQKILAL